MSRLAQTTRMMLSLVFVPILLIACGPPKTITETYTEAEFNGSDFPFQAEGLVADLQPGKVMVTGEIEGAKIVAEMTFEISDGKAYLQWQHMTVDGIEIGAEDLTNINKDMAEDIYTPEEGYAVTEVTATDDEVTITSTLQ